MRPRMFTVVSAISLLLAMGLAALWIASYYRLMWVQTSESLSGSGAGAHFSSHGVGATRGRLAYLLDDVYGEPAFVAAENAQVSITKNGRFGTQAAIPPDVNGPILQRTVVRGFAGFEVRTFTDRKFGGSPIQQALITKRYLMPLWFPLALSLVLPSFWLRDWRRRRQRERLGRCPNCYYDLRVSQDRCPECGMAIAR